MRLLGKLQNLPTMLSVLYVTPIKVATTSRLVTLHLHSKASLNYAGWQWRTEPLRAWCVFTRTTVKNNNVGLCWTRFMVQQSDPFFHCCLANIVHCNSHCCSAKRNGKQQLAGQCVKLLHLELQSFFELICSLINQVCHT